MRAALLWTAADIERWERLMAATGQLSAPAALAAAVASLVEDGVRRLAGGRPRPGPAPGGSTSSAPTAAGPPSA